MAVHWKTRLTVMDRAGKQCEECRNTQDLELHHVVSRNAGGSDGADNLRVLCYPCHARLHGRRITRKVRAPGPVVPSDPNSTEVLTLNQAAERLGISKQRVSILIQAGRLKAERFGHAWVIRAADLGTISERKIGRPRGKKGDPTLLTAPEAAERLGITRQHVYNLIAAGRLSAARVKNAWVIREADLAAYTRKPGGRPRKEKKG